MAGPLVFCLAFGGFLLLVSNIALTFYLYKADVMIITY